MHFVMQFFDFLLHIDIHLDTFIQIYGEFSYALFFLIIFLETGLVVTPFLPGDTLLFVAGAFASRGVLSAPLLFALLSIAAIAGDTVNYWIGNILGPKIFHKENVRFLNRKYMESAHNFYEKYGGKTIVIARFIPIIRTFAPFVAGIGKMNYGRFLLYNIAGGIGWVAIFIFGGFYFGNMPQVKENFTLVIFAIIVISILPAFIEYLRNRKTKNQ